MRERVRFGAFHGLEIGYVFNNLSSRNGTEVDPEDQEVARMMNTYWVNFAKRGDPNGEGLPNWPAFDQQKDQLLEFRPDGSAVATPDPKKARLDATEKAARSLLSR